MIRNNEKIEQWEEDCAKLLHPCAHTFIETVQYFVQNYDVLPLDSDDIRMKGFQTNVILNHCRDKLKNKSSEFSFDMRDEEIERWNDNQKMIHEEVRATSPEQFGLKMHGYVLPHSESNAVYYEEAYHMIQKIMMKHTRYDSTHMEKEDISIFFEETTEHYETSGGGKSLMNQLLIYLGVTEEDINNRTTRYHRYIRAIRDIKMLPRIPIE